ncbi:hypothetical protein PanWU01x14_303180 [Parasponia andersonii]|uniref:Uncharacterized protein n=1 Tax=Parasponia andersonii TaxID=3476 RepID=A0A2P5AT08_PARAD|nr:hypothetical protein PanWU01x14_303180 [Parasponia andersonii]
MKLCLRTGEISLYIFSSHAPSHTRFNSSIEKNENAGNRGRSVLQFVLFAFFMRNDAQTH